MRTDKATFEDMVVVVRSANRYTPILEKEYLKMLISFCPEIETVIAETLTVPLPKTIKVKDEETGKMVDASDEADAMRYFAELNTVASRHFVANAHYEQMQIVTPLLARIISSSGTPFQVGNNQRMECDEVIKAYRMFLAVDMQIITDEKGQKHFTSEGDNLWDEIQAAILRVDTPLTPKYQWPEEALTKAEREDPLSSPAIVSGSAV